MAEWKTGQLILGELLIEKEIGVTGGPLAQSGRMLNRSDLNRLRQDYAAHYRHDGGVYASYHVSYFRARKG